MNDKKLIAQALLDIAKNSITELIEDAKIDNEIKEAAKNMGLSIPDPDFAIFKTKWADIDKKNLNGVRLPRKAVEEGIQTLVGKNLNFEHQGAYNVCGFCLSVKIKKDEIECIQVFYKSLYPDKYEELIDKIKTKEAAVSFEIWNVDKNGESVVKVLEDGTKEITKIHCHGTGLLLVNPPACPTAKIFHLEAKKFTKDTEKVMHRVFEQDLVYAQLAIDNKEKEENIVDELKIEKIEKSSEETKIEGTPVETKTEESQTVEVKTEEKSEVAETKTEETKIEETKEAPKAEAEIKVEEPKIEEKAEEKKEEAQPIEVIEPKIIVKVTRIYSDVYVDTYIDGTSSGTSQGKSTTKIITEYKDGTKDVTESESEYKKKFDFAELEAEVNKAKSEKDAEIATLKEEQDKVLKAKDEELKNKNTELEQKSQEIAKLTKVEEKKEENLTVGAVETKDRYNKIQKEVNKKAFPSR